MGFAAHASGNRSAKIEGPVRDVTIDRYGEGAPPKFPAGVNHTANIWA